MKVGEVITAIEEKELSISDLAERFGVSDRTIQKKIKSLDFAWNSKLRRYEYKGQGEAEGVNAIDFTSLFSTKSNFSNGIESDSSFTNDGPSEEDIQIARTNSLTEAHSNTKEEVAAAIDEIDLLMMGKKRKKQKLYRGFYLDQELLEVIDRVESGSKSELVNAALRKVFKEKGLL